jgi:FlaA1/EpsC-like NDP-sugar epimerase
MGSSHLPGKMQQKYRLAGWVFADFVIGIAAYMIAYSLQNQLWLFKSINIIGFVLSATLITILVLFVMQVYQMYWPRTRGHNVAILLQAVLFATIINLLINFFWNPQPIPFNVLAVASIFLFGGIVVIRFRSRLIEGTVWRWRAIWKNEFPQVNIERVLIIGAGETGQMAANRLHKQKSKDTSYPIVGFVDDSPQIQGMILEGYKVLGTTSDIPEIVEREGIDVLVVAIHNVDGATFRHLLECCERTRARVQVVPDILEMFNIHSNYQPLLRDVRADDLIGRTIISRHEAVNLQLISQRTVMVTGAAGSIGSELVRQVLDYHQPTQVVLLDNNESALYDLYCDLTACYPSNRIAMTLVDVSDYASVREAFIAHKPQVIFHAAAYKHVPMLENHPNEALRVNIRGTLNVAEAAILNNAERFVMISTDKAVKPSSVMGASKRICELIVHALAERDDHQTQFTAVRFGNVLGSRGSVVPTFDRQIDRGGPVTVTHPEMTRYFMSISEAVNLVIHAAAMTKGDDIFVLKMGDKVRILDLAERMIRLRGLQPHKDIEITFTGIRPGEKLHEELYDDWESLMDTEHPHIMKLETWEMNGHAPILMRKVYEIVSKGIPDDNEALEALQAICEVHREHVEPQTYSI